MGDYALGVEPIEGLEPLAGIDRDAMAQLLLDAYRGTVDDEGETFEEALEAVDSLLGWSVPEHSWMLQRNDSLAAVCLTAIVEELPTINLIAVSPQHKRQGLARRIATKVLRDLDDGQTTEVQLAITDGNTASEQLFAGLGAKRVGPWPPLD